MRNNLIQKLYFFYQELLLAKLLRIMVIIFSSATVQVAYLQSTYIITLFIYPFDPIHNHNATIILSDSAAL